jgi:hypothetical protein
MHSPDYAKLIAGLDRLAEEMRRNAARRGRRRAAFAGKVRAIRLALSYVRLSRPTPIRLRAGG